MKRLPKKREKGIEKELSRLTYTVSHLFFSPLDFLASGKSSESDGLQLL